MKNILSTFLFIANCFLFTGSCFAQAGEWTWISGDSIAAQYGVFGTQGIPSANNTPGALAEAARWTDLQGNFWLYGGRFGSTFFADMWKFDPLTHEWTWISGSGTQVLSPGYWGTQGVSSPMNDPGPRWGPATWVDTSGNFWLLGGEGIAVNGYEYAQCDLWKYDPGTHIWTWMHGPNTGYEPGVYGSLGVPSSANHPSGLLVGYSTWTDSENNFWFYCGIDGVHFRKIMWKYNVVSNDWTWMSGDTTQDPAIYGPLNVFTSLSNPGARISCTPFKDAQDNFYFFGGAGTADPYNDLWKYNHTLKLWAWVGGQQNWNQPGNSGAKCEESTAFVPNERYYNTQCWWDGCGNVWFYGGNETGYLNPLHSDLWHLNLNTMKWSHVNGTLNSGNIPGVYGTKGLSSPLNQPGSKTLGASWMDGQGRLWMFGGFSTTYFAPMNDMWMYNPDTSCTYFICLPPGPVSFVCSNKTLCEKFCISFFDSSINNPTAWQWVLPGGDPSSSTDQNPSNICYTVPGSYDVTLITTSANGNDTLTLDNYITVYPTPPFPIISQVGYTLTSSLANSYLWQLNAVNIPGATNQSYNVLQSGLYTVIVGDLNGCENFANKYVLISGLDELSDASISVYSNPSSGSFTVEWTNAQITGEISIDVVNTLGQIVFSSQESQPMGTSDWKREIDLGDVARGVYFVEIKTKNEIIRKKMVIAH